MPIEQLTETSSLLSRGTKYPTANGNSESNATRPPDIPERIPIRSRTSSGQALLSAERPPSRNTPATSSVRLPSASTSPITAPIKSTPPSDFEVDRSPLLNHSIQIDKSQIAKTRPRNLPTKRLSNPTAEETSSHLNEEIETKNPPMPKLPSTDQMTSK